MKHVKILGLLSIIAAALLAIVATASATVATAPGGTAYTGTLKGVNTGPVTFHGVVDVTCNEGEIQGTIAQHGPSVTGQGQNTLFVYSGCNQHIVPLAKGTIEVHAIGNGNGTITSTNTETTVEFTTIFGNIHCVFSTVNTHIGTVTGATSDSGHATVHLEGAIPVKSGSFLCGSSAEITGAGKVTSPTGLRID
ncbi:MAG TPA: hypothetical protein VI039_00690 [Solirubrobacterales bacterium]